jgi:hypothetical protein
MLASSTDPWRRGITGTGSDNTRIETGHAMRSSYPARDGQSWRGELLRGRHTWRHLPRTVVSRGQAAMNRDSRNARPSLRIEPLVRQYVVAGSLLTKDDMKRIECEVAPLSGGRFESRRHPDIDRISGRSLAGVARIVHSGPIDRLGASTVRLGSQQGSARIAALPGRMGRLYLGRALERMQHDGSAGSSARMRQ